MKKVLILASGNGSNAENISKFLKKTDSKNKIKVLCNVEKAGVFEKMKKLKIPCILIQISNNLSLLNECIDYQPDLIILAGYLKKIPKELIDLFKKRIINIHPSLLPKYGGKGMYGDKVHNQVLINNETETGITIHYVNEKYDKGEIIFQKKVILNKDETLSTIKTKIKSLEMKYFPIIIYQLVAELVYGLLTRRKICGLTI